MAAYPTDKCVVSDRPLGKSTQNLMLDGTLVRVCCKRCAKKAKAEPDALVARVRNAALSAQREAYPTNKCLVSNHEFDAEDAADVEVLGRLVRLCCAGCKKKVLADPRGVIAKIDAAAAK